MRHVLVKTKAEALKVRALLAADNTDANWAKVAKKYWTDPGTKNSGGDLGRIKPDGEALRQRRLRAKAQHRSPCRSTAVRLARHRGHQDHPATSDLRSAKANIKRRSSPDAAAGMVDLAPEATKAADVEYAAGYDPPADRRPERLRRRPRRRQVGRRGSPCRAGSRAWACGYYTSAPSPRGARSFAAGAGRRRLLVPRDLRPTSRAHGRGHGLPRPRVRCRRRPAVLRAGRRRHLMCRRRTVGRRWRGRCGRGRGSGRPLETVPAGPASTTAWSARSSSRCGTSPRSCARSARGTACSGRDIISYTLEEVYELADAIAGDDSGEHGEPATSSFRSTSSRSARGAAPATWAAWRRRSRQAHPPPRPHLRRRRRRRPRRARPVGAHQARAGGPRGHLPRRAGHSAGAALRAQAAGARRGGGFDWQSAPRRFPRSPRSRRAGRGAGSPRAAGRV